MNIAVYGADDINRNYYYLLQVMNLCIGVSLNCAVLGEQTAPSGVLCMLVAVTALLLCDCAGCGPGAPPALGRHRRFRRHLQEGRRSHRGVSTDFVCLVCRGDFVQQCASGLYLLCIYTACGSCGGHCGAAHCAETSCSHCGAAQCAHTSLSSTWIHCEGTITTTGWAPTAAGTGAAASGRTT